MIALGMVLPPWSVYSRTQTAEVRVEIAGGPLRPVMIQLPPMADGTTFAIAESEVSQLHLYRVFGWMPLHIADRNSASWQACPAPFNLETFHMPATCVAARDAAEYANRLTTIENRARILKGETPLTLCYDSGFLVSDRTCTGYRLPTVEEWIYAATANGQVHSDADDKADDLCRYAHLSQCPQAVAHPRKVKELLPSPWYIYDAYGNVAEMAEIRGGGRVMILGGSWTQRSESRSMDWRSSASSTGFRILRRAGTNVPFTER